MTVLDSRNSTPAWDKTQQFYIFGRGISFSMSPTIHNTGFRHHGLNKYYQIHEVDKVDECGPFIQSPDFGGASVTMPYKLQVSRFCDSISPEAKLIGAINTLSIQPDPSGRTKIRGDNTDWSGLVKCIQENYPSHASQHRENGWVIGAGGASRAALYALHRSGVQNIYISNRTRANADQIIADYAHLFKITYIESWKDMNAHAADIIIGTIPADTITDDSFKDVQWKEQGGLCIDMSYKPRVTPLMSIARNQGSWNTASGIDVLLEQGYLQYNMWTGLDSPRELVRYAVGIDGEES
ncbi:quinate 5-dehydrogenase, protein [Myriangium duriaei CBS 260.36]|uniref:Quinate 5-dehydrogenase, protein n=1 Tax=Myriangium duriaei CBS 260.36 TaxID=1168546 RepID=A0A9P4MD30_9PEZI|nr:quinate 5-dehydrogenase, protein [Myriangium duriaei CBS 260.36]